MSAEKDKNQPEKKKWPWLALGGFVLLLLGIKPPKSH